MTSEHITQLLQQMPVPGREHNARASLVLPALQRIQQALGYIPAEAMAIVARFTGVTESHVFGVATFYTQFKFSPPGKHHITVCCGTACHVRGSAKLVDDLRDRLHIEPGETTADGNFSFETTACFGSCALAPVIVVDGKVQGRLHRSGLMKTITALEVQDQSSGEELA